MRIDKRREGRWWIDEKRRYGNGEIAPLLSAIMEEADDFAKGSWDFSES